METEAKFVVPDRATFERLRHAAGFGAYERRGGRKLEIADRYLDTRDHRFRSRRLALRLRESKGADGIRLTLKQLGAPTDRAVHQRQEYEAEVSGLDVASWPPGEARRLVDEIANGEPLAELVAVDQTRLVSDLYDGTRLVAEFSLDQVALKTKGPPGTSLELEIELIADGAASDLDALCDLLVRDYALSPQPLSKFERAMIQKANDPRPMPSASPAQEHAVDAAPAEPANPAAGDQEPSTTHAPKSDAGVLLTDSIGDAARKIVSLHFASMLKNEEGTLRGDDPDAVHDMRVATRRMRAALRLLGPYLDAGDLVAQVRRGLRKLTRALGRVRDMDVFIAQARDFRDALLNSHRGDIDELLQNWCEERERGHKQLIDLLDSKKYSRFKRRMKKYLAMVDAEPDQRHGAQPHQVRHIAASSIWARYEAVRAYETLMAAPTIAQLHALRICCKYFRYTLECFREVLPADAGEMIHDIEAVQDHLGEMHDADVAASLTRKFRSDRQGSEARLTSRDPADTELPFGSAAFLAQREAFVRFLASDFASTWERIASSAWRARLASTIAAI